MIVCLGARTGYRLLRRTDADAGYTGFYVHTLLGLIVAGPLLLVVPVSLCRPVCPKPC